MKLNFDCVRQILLCVEENTSLRQGCFFIDSGFEELMPEFYENDPIPKPAEYQVKLLKHFDNDELIYHVNYCVDAGLLCVAESNDSCRIVVNDLTPKGHDFLENIRDNKVWANIKGIGAKIGSKSLEATVQIASNVIAEIIKAQFGIH